MTRLILYAGTLALVAACGKAPASAANTLVTASTEPAPAAPAVPAAATTVAAHDLTLPAGTILPVTLETTVGSDISRVESPVHAHLRHAVTLHGVEVLPIGAAISGHVTAAQRPGKVKGRGYVAMRFTTLDTPGHGASPISTATVSHMAPATKEKDAVEILAPAAGGAVIGRLVGGQSGAAAGAAIGGAAGTGYVLSTRGKEARISKGAALSVKLTAPLTVRVEG
jgi:hypothetical protein